MDIPVTTTTTTTPANPSPAEQAAGVRSHFEEVLVEADAWYVISQRWWNLWTDYVDWDSFKTAPSSADEAGPDLDTPIPLRRTCSGPQSGLAPPSIDNTHLTLRPTEVSTDDGGPLQIDLIEQRDFLLIPQTCWDLLHKWYGGGPILKRNVILIGCRELQVELYPLQLMMYKVDSGGHAQPHSANSLSVSRKKIVSALIKDIHQTYIQSDAASVNDLRLWYRPDSTLDQTLIFETSGWEIVGPDTDSLEDVGISDGMALLLEQRVPSAAGALTWPLFDRQRREYRATLFKDPHNSSGPPLAVGDKVDASEESGSYGAKWYPGTIVGEDATRVLVQFHYRKAPARKMPDIRKEKGGWFSAAELSDETIAALKKVFDHYANLDTDKTHIDRKAIASLISCATNTICQQEDFRVVNMLNDYDEDKDGLLTVDDFLRYWTSRAQSNTHFLKEELQYLYKRAKDDFGTPTEKDKLLEEGKEWLPRNSDRLATAKTHVLDYPYIRQDDREFRDFRAHDKVDLRVGKSWHAARIVSVDWNDYTILVERTAGSGTTSNSCAHSSYSMTPYRYSMAHVDIASDPGGREWLPIESERLAQFQSKTVGNYSDPSPKAASATPVTGACEAAGACGLNNLGNTCFMNATLQALSNTSPLRDYYMSGKFVHEICKCPLSMDGRLAHGFSDLLKMLWANTHRTVSPTKLKSLVGEKRPEFQGYQQHDAQELLTFLLDGLHEDGNRVPYPRPCVEDPNCDGKSDHEIAQEAWSGYLKRNSSKIVDIFQFQIRSEVNFPTVGDKSLTFDPMMYLSLQVPKPPHSVQMTVLPLKYPSAAPVKCSVRIAKDKTFKNLEAAVAQEFIPPSRSNALVAEQQRCFIFADLFDNRVCKFFNSSRAVSEIRPGDKVWAFEVALLPDLPEEKQEFCAVYLRKRTKYTGFSSNTTLNNGSNYSFGRFAPPQIIAIQPGVSTNADVRRRMLEFADTLKDIFGNDDMTVSLTVTSTYASDEGTSLPETGIFQLAIGEVLSLNFLGLETTTGKESLLPTPVAKGGNDGSDDDVVIEVSLEQCLETFSQTEELSQDDWVYCRKTAAFEKSLKKMEIWTTPEILIMHLKRFGRERITGPLEKIDTLVRFPMQLDLQRWVRGPQQGSGTAYSLYATVNHSGGLGGGHYTAYAKLGQDSDQQWFYFNDSTASRASESDVVSKASYILFYRRSDHASQ